MCMCVCVYVKAFPFAEERTADLIYAYDTNWRMMTGKVTRNVITT